MDLTQANQHNKAKQNATNVRMSVAFLETTIKQITLGALEHLPSSGSAPGAPATRVSSSTKSDEKQIHSI